MVLLSPATARPGRRREPAVAPLPRAGRAQRQDAWGGDQAREQAGVGPHGQGAGRLQGDPTGSQATTPPPLMDTSGLCFMLLYASHVFYKYSLIYAEYQEF